MKLERTVVIQGRVTSIGFHRVMRRYRPHVVALNEAEIETILIASVPYQVSQLSITSCKGALLSLYSCLSMKAIRELVLDESSAQTLLLHRSALLRNVQRVDLMECVLGEDLESAIAMMKGLRRLSLFKCTLNDDNLEWLAQLKRLECLLLTSSAALGDVPLKLSGLRELAMLDTLDIADVDVVEDDLRALSRRATLEVLR